MVKAMAKDSVKRQATVMLLLQALGNLLPANKKSLR
jgi:hypothetical protein